LPEGLVDGRLNFYALLDVLSVVSLFNTLGEGGDVVGPSQLVPARLRLHFFIPKLDLLPTSDRDEHHHEQRTQGNPTLRHHAFLL
jgi:hypothetical protein